MYTCPTCGGNLDVALDLEAIRRSYQPDDFLSRREASLWRYLPLLPADFPSAGENTPLALAGGTPVLALPRLAARLGLEALWLKDESLEDSANLPGPDILAREIAENLESALDQFTTISQSLEE